MSWPPTAAAEWTAFWTMLLVVAAGAAFYVAWRQLGEIRSQRRDANRAYVLVTPEANIETHALEIVVENAGATHAKDVRIEFSPPLTAAHDAVRDPAIESLWNPPLLPPGYSYRTTLDMSHERLNAGLPMQFDATVSWKSPATDDEYELRETYRVDFQRFFDMEIWGINHERDRTRALKAISGDLAKIARSVKKISGE